MTALRFDEFAFTGGGRINMIGPLEDVLQFFSMIETYAAPSLDDAGRLLLLDRLYKRYVPFAETPRAVEAMQRVQDCFAKVPTSQIDWAAQGFHDRDTSFKLDRANLGDAAENFFRQFSAVASSVMFYSVEGRPRLKPLKLGRSDFGSILREKERPLEEYDALQGPPFWLA